jgi:hypothetical protein
MNTPSKDIMSILVDVGIASAVATNDWFVVGEDFPITPDRAIRVMISGGNAPALNLDGNVTYDQPTVQVMVRGKREDRQAAEEKARAIRDELHGLRDEAWGGSQYIQIWARGDILAAGQDERERPFYSVNFLIWRR